MFVLVFIVLALAIFLYVHNKCKKYPSWVTSQGLPVPKELRSYFGYIPILVDLRRQHDIFLSMFKEHGGIFYFPSGVGNLFGIANCVILGDNEIGQQLLKSTVVKGYMYKALRVLDGGKNLVSSETTAEYKLHKKIASFAFSPSWLTSNAFPVMKVEVEKFIEYLRKNPSLDIDRAMSLLAINIVFNGILGSNIDALYDHNSIVYRGTWGYVTNIGKLVHNPLLFFSRVPFKGRESWNDIKKGVRNELQNEVNSNTQSSYLLGDYVNAIKNKEMTFEDVVEDLAIMVVGGHETTAHSMGFFLYCMAMNKNIENEARQEVDNILGERKIPEYDDIKKLTYFKNCVYESMRMYPVTPKSWRILSSEQDVGGFKIPAGTSVWFSYNSMNNNPKHWENPEKFIPERFNDERKAHDLANFSFGPRSCIGINFAKLEMFLVLAALLRNFYWEVDPNYKLVTYAGASLTPLGGLPMKFKYRE